MIVYLKQVYYYLEDVIFMTCTFFGHRNAVEKIIKPTLESVMSLTENYANRIGN